MTTSFEKLTSLTGRFNNLSRGQQVLAVVGGVAASFAAWSLSYIAYYRTTEKRYPFNSYTTSSEAINGMDLTNKYAIVTGSNTGIGKETAKILYKQGCNVIIACRNIEKGNNAKVDIMNNLKTTTKGSIEVMQLDLSSLKSVREFAINFTSTYKELNYLINNAGIMALPEFSTTTEGYEKQFGVNHIGHFYLTQLLLPTIIKSKGRIINVSSSAHRFSTYDKYDAFLNKAMKNNDGPSKEDYQSWPNYGIAKTSNILFSRELHRRYAKQGITACSLHPGAIMSSELGRNVKFEGISTLLMVVNIGFNLKFRMDNMKSMEQGAATTLRCVSLSDEELKGGHYYMNCRSGRDFNKIFSAAKDSLSKQYNDYEKESIEARLWTLSEQLITQKGFKLTL